MVDETNLGSKKSHVSGRWEKDALRAVGANVESMRQTPPCQDRPGNIAHPSVPTSQYLGPCPIQPYVRPLDDARRATAMLGSQIGAGDRMEKARPAGVRWVWKMSNLDRLLRTETTECDFLDAATTSQHPRQRRSQGSDGFEEARERESDAVSNSGLVATMLCIDESSIYLMTVRRKYLPAIPYRPRAQATSPNPTHQIVLLGIVTKIPAYSFPLS